MNAAGALFEAYCRLPPPLRTVAASARGLYLRASRYGGETDRLAAAALKREHWPAHRWNHWQQERLAYLLHRAATRVPHYQALWAERRRRGDRRSWDTLENWPILEKETVRAAPRSFVADDCDGRTMVRHHTSGTSGKPLEVTLSRFTLRHWYALSEARSRLWHGVSRTARWAILGGQLVTPVVQRRPPFWVWNAPLHQLYMSAYHLAPDLIPHYLDALAWWRIEYLWGYSSALHELALGAIRAGRRDLQMIVAITNAEPLLPRQRETISRAFQCPVRETYGMAEIVAAASECRCQTLHLWPEAGWLELMDGEEPAARGQAGDLICTSLLNTDMPLVRYRVGDRAVLPKELAGCACGRSLPAVDRIEGRLDETLYTRDGRAVGRLDPVFKLSLPVVEAQMVQESLQRVKVRYVPAAGFAPVHGRKIADELRARMGDIDVVLEPLAAIPRTAAGKFQAVVCRVPRSEIDEARAGSSKA